jgi:SSS family solute:Na+ symporter
LKAELTMAHAFPGNPPLAAALTAPDYVVLFLYIVATVVLGGLMCRGQTSLGGYFLAERKTHWILACVSIIATDISAISYMGMPGWVYEKDLKYSVGSVLYPVVMLIVVIVFVPLFFRLKVFTVYEYLERRFHPTARTVTAVLFLFLRGVHLAAAIYIPSVAFSTFVGVPELWCILLIGSLTTIYTLLGGMKAVIWTDFLQFVVMFGGLFLMMGILLSYLHWDPVGIWSAAGHMISSKTGTPHTTLVDFRPDLKTEATVWSIIAFYMIYNVGTYGSDQVIVQRYFTMGTFREIAKSVLGAGLLSTLSVFCLAFVGLLLTVYYGGHPELAATVRKADDILPNFVVHCLPAGVRGLIFAALVATTMSCLSAGLNSFATVGVMDLYKRHGAGRYATEARCLRLAKVFTLLGGAALTLVAIWVSTLHRPILEIANELASMFIGPVTGIFFLGVLTRRANLLGVLVGAVAGLVTSFALCYWQPLSQNVNWMWAGPFSCLATFVAGYATSIALPEAGRSPAEDLSTPVARAPEEA